MQRTRQIRSQVQSRHLTGSASWIIQQLRAFTGNCIKRADLLSSARRYGNVKTLATDGEGENLKIKVNKDTVTVIQSRIQIISFSYSNKTGLHSLLLLCLKNTEIESMDISEWITFNI